MTARWLVVLAAVASSTIVHGRPASLLAQRAVPARDAAREGGATAVIRGRVTAAATGQPLHRVRITLNGVVPNPLTTVTDMRGAFEIGEVPAGSFTLTAARAGYLTAQYGSRVPRQAGRPITVGNGQTVEGLEIALARGAVLAGRIIDDVGDPAPGVRVEAVETRYLRGRRVAVAARIARTNDEGDYRLSDLEPGSYQVRASTREVWEADDAQTTYSYAVTYFPGVTAAERPHSIELKTGQQVDGVDFHLVPGRAARISGVVESPTGERQADQVVYLSDIARTVGGALLSSGNAGTTKTDAAGVFEFPKLPPGEYLAMTGGPNDRATDTVIVQAGDSKHLVLAIKSPTLAAGSIVTDEGAPPPFSPARIMVLPIRTDMESALAPWGAPRETPPGADWTFRIPNIDGQYLFRVTGLPEDWMLKQVRLGRRDITDAPLAIARGGTDIAGLQIVVSRRAARIAGVVVDAAGSSAPDATVIVFAEDRTLWGIGSRFVRAGRPNSAGQFSIGGLVPGVYRAIAVDVVADGQWEDVQFLQGVFKQAIRVEAAEGAPEKVTLKQESVR